LSQFEFVFYELLIKDHCCGGAVFAGGIEFSAGGVEFTAGGGVLPSAGGVPNWELFRLKLGEAPFVTWFIPF
jgi:hypothetical protein